VTIKIFQPELGLLRAKLAILESRFKEEAAAHARTRELLEEAVAREETTDLLRFVLENMPVLMNAFDENGVCVAWNRECETVLGFSADEMIGNPRALELFVPDTAYRERMAALWATKGDHRDWGWEHTGKDGRKLIVAWSNLSNTFSVDGWATWGVGVDMTERKQLMKFLRSAKVEAELANRTKSEFLANMTHELRTPLNAIIGFSQVLERGIAGAVTDKQREYLKDIESSGNHLLGIISDILDLSKFELGAKEILDEQVDLAETISGSLRLVRDRLDTAGLTFQAQELKAVPLLRGDKRRLKQVLLNLLSNAIKFTNRGGSVTISGKTAEDGSVRLEVTDSGIGMTPSDIKKSLTRFGQVESGLARNYEGTGLGLPISKCIMEAHGGKLEIESEHGVGTTVRLIFPAQRIIRNSLLAR